MMDTGTLRWKFDISAFRLIGRDLITDRVTALFELVKNCYDANANVVTVHFNNVSPDSKGISSIVIDDDGYGMSFEDVRDKWMVIGTSSKRRNKISPSPYSRRCVGEKGIGRFAVDKLGDYITIKTKKKGEKQWLTVTIDWTKYEDQAMAEGEQDLLFTDVDNNFQYQSCDDDSISGTQIAISHIREAWTKSDVERFLRESSRITSPYYPQIYPFLIQVYADEYGIMIFDYRKQKLGHDRRERPIHLILDEAHRYIRKDANYIMRENIFEKIAREGRKYSLYLIISSQRPSELSQTVLSQCGNYIVHRIQNEVDMKYIYSVLPYFSDDYITKIKQAIPGEALIFGNCVPMPLMVKVTKANPAPNSDNCIISKEWFNLENLNNENDEL